MKIRERGFATVELVIIVVVIAALAGAGYWVYKQRNDDKDAKNADTSQQETAADDTSAPEVNDTGDLQKAEQALDDADVDANTADSTELDSQTSNF